MVGKVVGKVVGVVVGKDGKVDRKVVGTGGAERNVCRGVGHNRRGEVQGRRTASGRIDVGKGGARAGEGG